MPEKQPHRFILPYARPAAQLAGQPRLACASLGIAVLSLLWQAMNAFNHLNGLIPLSYDGRNAIGVSGAGVAALFAIRSYGRRFHNQPLSNLAVFVSVLAILFAAACIPHL